MDILLLPPVSTAGIRRARDHHPNQPDQKREHIVVHNYPLGN